MLAVLDYPKNEIQNRLDTEIQKLSNIEQNVRDIKKYGDKSPFDFNEIDQHEDEINLNDFLDLVENI